MMRMTVSTFTLLAALLVGCQAAPPPPFKVMSMEVLGEVPGGAFGLGGRFPAVLKVIEQQSPDVLAVQGISPEQFASLGKRLPDGYATATWSARKDDGKLWKTPVVGLAYKTAMFTPLDEGGFWHSATPDEPMTKSWDAKNVTCSYWVRLQFKQATQHEVVVFASRLDHVGPQARAQAAQLIRRYIEARPGAPTVVLLNAHSGPRGSAYKELTDDRGNFAHLFDPFATLDEQSTLVGTRHNFKGGEDVPRTDFILHSRQLKPLGQQVIRTKVEETYPGPHYPITATLELITKQ